MPKVGSGDGVANIRIHRQSLEGTNSLDQIPNVKTIYIEHSNGFYKYQINKIMVDPEDSDAFYMNVKQEHGTPPTGSASSALVFTPYIAGKFKNSDFDPLLSNATEGHTSLKYQIVDNNESQLTPTNLAAINNRTAGFAQVQDSNYEVESYTRPRYDGTKHTANNFNLESSTGLVPVSDTHAYFAYFNWIGGTSPDLFRKSQASIKYLIDLDGNISSPRGNDSEVLQLMKQNFVAGEEVIVTLDNPNYAGSNMQGLNGEKTVHKGGQRLENLLSTISGSYARAITGSSLYFEIIETGGVQKITSTGILTGEFTQTGGASAFITGSISDSLLNGTHRFIGISGNDITASTPVSTDSATLYLPADEAGYLQPTLPLTIAPNDVITFLRKSTNTYTEFLIRSVTSGSNLYLELDKNINMSDYEARGYSIRRYVDAAGSIILDTDKPAGGTSGGIIQPKFMPPGTEEKLQTIIDDLKQKGII